MFTLEALEANNCTQNNVQRNRQRLQSRVLTAHMHSEQHDVTVSIVYNSRC